MALDAANELPRITRDDVPMGGISCPQCGYHRFWTTRTEAIPGEVRRRRECRRCRHRIVTIERVRQ